VFQSGTKAWGCAMSTLQKIIKFRVLGQTGRGVYLQTGFQKNVYLECCFVFCEVGEGKVGLEAKVVFLFFVKI
jgi:hypothetical protein